MASPKRNAKKAYRALKRSGFSTRMAKVGANNVGRATVIVNKKKGYKRRSYKKKSYKMRSYRKRRY